MNFLQQIPQDLINFILVAIFSFIFGMEQRLHHQDREGLTLFGTDRTFTLIGILGFILYYVDDTYRLYIFGAILIGLLFSIFYWHKAASVERYGITSIIVALLTYFLTPLVYKAPPWLTMLVVVLIMILVESKETLVSFSRKFDKYEFTTLAKFIIIAGVILPLLPNKPLIPGLDITPYKFWLAIVVVSTISYLSYLIKKFIFPQAGILLTAILGGMYSSTATTVILARKSRGQSPAHVAGGIIAATAVMYVRVWILAMIFNRQAALRLAPYFALLILISAAFAFYFLRMDLSHKDERIDFKADKNPLEFTTALVFGLLFTFFAILSDFVMKNFGDIGMGILSLIVGITDIDPYLLSLFQSAGHISVKIIIIATILATASNNIAKMVYAIILGIKEMKKFVILAFLSLFVVSLAMVFTIYLW